MVFVVRLAIDNRGQDNPMRRNLLGAAAALTMLTAACGSESTFTRTCYEVPEDIADIRGDTVVTATGVRYIDQFEGAGATAATCTEVTVSYTGTLLDGNAFDSGTFTFIPGAAQVVSGFEQGVVGMRVEGVRRIIIPPELAYGSQPITDNQTGEVVIPANSTLVFDVTVTGVRQINLTR